MSFECKYIKGTSSKAVVLIHGYGASMDDLAPLHSWLDPEGEYHWYFPNGPLRIPFGMGYEGRAWFAIDMAELERAMATGKHRDFSGVSHPDFTKAVSEMEGFMATLAEKHTEIVIGGFSQGAMVASHVAARQKNKLAGLVLLSATLVDRHALEEARGPGLPFFQSHGDADPLLGFSAAKDLHDVLAKKGYQGIWYPFRGGHEIPQGVLQSLKSFLKSILA